MRSEIFREYDIRGIADRDLTDEVVSTLGRSIGTYLRNHGSNRLSLGRDVRLSSNRLRDRLVEGLLSTGVRVFDLGECPTPLLYFSLHQLEVDGGVMITGSHNPAEYNGFKIAIGKSTLYGEQIQKLRQIAESGNWENGQGTLEEVRLTRKYVNQLVSSFGRLASPPKVVIDCGNGTASLVAESVYREIGCEVIPLFCQVDGSFPNHHPDPTVPEYLEDLIKRVQQEEADLGIAFDGDSDRIGVIDERGKIIWGDELMVLYSRDILRDRPGSTFIAEVKCSQNLYDDIEEKGGRAIMWKAGHSLIKAKMKEEDAVLAGEMSGHMFFADRYYGFDDAIYAGARVLEICANSKQKLSEMLADLPETIATPEIRVDCPEQQKFEVVRRAQEAFSQEFKTITVDGVRVLFDDGWGLVRASNTQPALVLRFEAKSEKRLEEIRSLIQSRLDQIISEVDRGNTL